MTNDISNPTTLDPVQVTFGLPGRLAADFTSLVQAGVYLSLDDTLRDGLVTSWRYMKGTFHSLRIDVGEGEPRPSDEVTQDPESEAQS